MAPEAWPGDVLEARFKTTKPSGKVPCVVFASGALSPTHRGHALMLHQAEDRLQRLGYEVLGGWLSPSNDLTVLADAKARGVPELGHDFRLHLAELSVAEDSFISVGSWEASLKKVPTDLEVARSLHEAVNAKFGHEFPKGTGPIRVFCVCGCDHMAKFKLKGGFGSTQMGVVVVPREDTDEILLEKPGMMVFVAEPASGDAAALSSTKLRQAIIDGDKTYITGAMHPAAARCVLQPTLIEQQNMRVDFEHLGVINPALDIIATDGPWPLAKLKKRLNELQPDDIPAVVIVSGSMSPAHLGHFEVMQKGCERLERAGYKILGGFLSPQNATGAAAEMRAVEGSEDEVALSTGFRLKCTKIAACDNDSVSLGAWEASVMGRVPTPHEVMRHLASYLNSNLPELKDKQIEHLRIFYACGPGQAARRGLNQSIGKSDKGIVIVPRADEDCFILEKPGNLFFVADPAEGEANIKVAAKIRAALQQGNAAYVASVMPPGVARFMLSPTATELSALRADFAVLRPQATSGTLRLTDPSAADEAKAKFKAVLETWAGPAGSIAIEDMTRLLEALDPSWTSSELNTFASGAYGAVNKAGRIPCDALVDWMFGGVL